MRRKDRLKQKTKIYVIEVPYPNDEFRFFKIGRSKNVLRRVGDIQVGCPWEIKLLFESEEVEVCVEKEIHEALQHFHLRGEWFQVPKNEKILPIIKDFCEGKIHKVKWIEIAKVKRRLGKYNSKITSCKSYLKRKTAKESKKESTRKRIQELTVRKKRAEAELHKLLNKT